MPIYVRAGAIIPFDPVRQYMTQPVDRADDDSRLHRRQRQFRWYEDDGNSQEYLRGKFAWTHLKWDDAAKRLTIERDTTAGTLEPPARKLLVQLLPEGKTAEVNYDGRREDVRF